MKPKVAFVEVISNNNLFPFKLPNIGIVYLATILKGKGYQTRVFSEQYKKIFLKNKGVYKPILDYDVIGITAVTASISKAYELAKAIKKARPSAKIILGGSHSSFMPEEALKYCDHIIQGEAEDVILDIVEGKIKDKIIAGKKIEDLDKLPFPDFDLVEGMKFYSKIFPTPISTSRGCPFACNFCTVTSFFGIKYRQRSADSLLNEVKYQYEKGHKAFFFYDDNFAANKERMKEFLRKLLESGMKIRWAGQARVDVARDEELMDLMKQTKCKFVLIGFESINQKSLDSINKKQSLSDMEGCIKMFNKKDIGIHGAFILGCDNDSKSSFDDVLRFCEKYGIYSAQFTTLTPLPGSALFSELDSKNKIISKEWSLYDTTHVLSEPNNGMSPYELQTRLMKLWCKFYSFGEGIKYEINRISKQKQKLDIKRTLKRLGLILLMKIWLFNYIQHNRGYYKFLKGYSS